MKYVIDDSFLFDIYISLIDIYLSGLLSTRVNEVIDLFITYLLLINIISVIWNLQIEKRMLNVASSVMLHD